MNASSRSHLHIAAERTLPWITGLWVFAELLSLRLGLLDRFFFDTLHADVQGIDFYSLPKAWLNLANGRSLYATFDPPAYGPHFTWYLAHPVLCVLLGWPLSHLDPGDSYGVFTMLSLGVMAASASLLARESDDALTRRAIWMLLLGAFPTFDMLYVGNVQSLTVLGLSLLFAGMVRLARDKDHAQAYMLAGLLLSLFTKPVVLLMFPLLLLLRETRRTATRALAAYASVSVVFEVWRRLNPESIGMERVAWLALHPGFVRGTMNIYLNGLTLTPDMRDNSIHWLNLVAQSGFRLSHIDVVSLPVFLDTLLGLHTPDWLYLQPTLAVLVLSALIPRVRVAGVRRECALLLAMAASLSFFLSYPTVWEYQYTAVLPVAAVLLMLRDSVMLQRPVRASMLGLSACLWLPSLYFLSGSAEPTAAVTTLVRLDRVLPVTLLFLLLLWSVSRAVLSDARQARAAAEPMRGYSSRAGSRA